MTCPVCVASRVSRRAIFAPLVGRMRNDSHRNQFYWDALGRCVKDKCVVDIGGWGRRNSPCWFGVKTSREPREPELVGLKTHVSIVFTCQCCWQFLHVP